MKVFNAEYLDSLIAQAKLSPRQRQHRNVHLSYEDPCQRLFNAIEPGSYIRPHRHTGSAKSEMLIAVRGLMAFITFDDEGAVTSMQYFGSEVYGHNVCVGVEIKSCRWHTVIALTHGAVLLELKAGPFDPVLPKEMAQWAPVEDGPDAVMFLKYLRDAVIQKLGNLVDEVQKMRIEVSSES